MKIVISKVSKSRKGIALLLVLIGTACFFIGCATSYQPQSFSGGFSVSSYAPDEANITFSANGFSSPKRAMDFAVLKAAEMCKERGYNYIYLVSIDQHSNYSQFVTPGVDYFGKNYSVSMPATSQTISKPVANITVRFVAEPQPNSAMRAYDASYLISSIRQAYNLDGGSSSSGSNITSGSSPGMVALESARPFINEGYKHLLNQDYEGAINAFDNALRIKPDYLPILIERGFAKFRKLDYAGSIADDSRVIQINAGSEKAYKNRGDAEYLSGDLVAALADYEQATRLNGQGYGLLMRHLVLLRLGRANTDSLGTEIGSMPNAWTTSIGLFMVGQISKEEFQRRVESSGNLEGRQGRYCEMCYYSGVVDLNAGRKSEARKEFEECLSSGVFSYSEFTLARVELAGIAN